MSALGRFGAPGYLFGLSLIAAAILLSVRKRGPRATPGTVLAGFAAAAAVFAVDYWGLRADRGHGAVPALALVWGPFAALCLVRGWLERSPRT